MMPKRRTSISLGGGLLLALTLALSACDTGEKPAPDPSVSVDSAETRTANVTAADTSCPGPAPKPFTALDPKNKSQPWSVVTAYLQENSLAADSVTGPVRLCKNCDQIPATLRPLANTCAIDPESGGQNWLMGKIVANAPLTGSNEKMFGKGNDSSFVYLVTQSNMTHVIYPKKDNKGEMVIGYVPGVNQSSPRWNFVACKEPKHGNAAWGTYPAGQKPVCGQGMTADPAAQRDSAANVGDPGEELLSYSWMACIGGCCRFYGPQPPFTGEEEEEVGGGNPGGGNPGGGNPGGGNQGGGQPGRPKNR